VPTLFRQAEGNIVDGAIREPSGDPARSENLCMHESLHAREPGGPTVTRSMVGWGGSCGEGQGRKPVMHDRRKSDGLVVPAKLPNKAADAVAEAVEGRGPGKGNAASETRPGRSAGVSVSSGLDRVRQVARKDKDARFTALPWPDARFDAKTRARSPVR
jgi:RNA-directed DNA polymerase